MRLRQREGDVGIALWSAEFSSASGGNDSVLFAADCVCSRRCAASERTLVFPQFCSVVFVKGSNYVAPRAARCNNRAAKFSVPVIGMPLFVRSGYSPSGRGDAVRRGLNKSDFSNLLVHKDPKFHLFRRTPSLITLSFTGRSFHLFFQMFF